MEKTNISDKELAQMKREIAEGLAINRHSLICYMPFTGNIATRFDLIPVRDIRCRTACTDGKNIYFDCDFYLRLTKEERTFVLAHEIWHNIMLHFSRQQTRDSGLFNIATDMEVNNILSDNANSVCFSLPEGVLFPPENLKGKPAEEIYDWLLKEQKKLKKQQQGQSNSKGSSCSSGSSNKSKTSGNISGQFDKHISDNDADAEEADTSSISDRWGEVGLDPDFKPFVSPEAAEKIREAVIAAAQQTQRQQGTLPAGIESYLDKLKKPEINWRDELCNFVTQCYGGNRQWLPPNRRYVYNDTYFQSRRSQSINVAVCVDTSGSCIADLPKFFAELKSLVETFGSYTIHLLQCDAAVEKHDVYDDNNPLEFEDEYIAWSGGGGTSFTPCFEYIDGNEIDVDCIIYLTDGYGDAPDEPPAVPVLWILTNDGSKDFCEWGKKIRFKESSF